MSSPSCEGLKLELEGWRPKPVRRLRTLEGKYKVGSYHLRTILLLLLLMLYGVDHLYFSGELAVDFRGTKS